MTGTGELQYARQDGRVDARWKEVDDRVDKSASVDKGEREIMYLFMQRLDISRPIAPRR